MSEIAQLRERIDQEIAAMQHAKEYAAVARHDIITHHYNSLGVCFDELTKELGEPEAVAILMDLMERGGVC